MLNLQGLHIRAALFRSIRSFFHQQGFLEVDTPVRQPVIIPESSIVPIMAEGQYLQTSPELCMKRLLASGCDKIFQICPCFRKEEKGRKHLEEFMMLEWYRTNADYHQLMVDCEELLQYVVTSIGEDFPGFWLAEKKKETAQILTGAGERLTVSDAFSQFAPVSARTALSEDRFDELLVEYIEPRLGQHAPCFLMDYPVELASLAKRDPVTPEIAQRFELYISGVELANGFSELTDPVEQRERFSEELSRISASLGKRQELPQKFLEDLERLDSAAGIAFGVDRLMMLLVGLDDIGKAVTFSEKDHL